MKAHVEDVGDLTPASARFMAEQVDNGGYFSAGDALRAMADRLESDLVMREELDGLSNDIGSWDAHTEREAHLVRTVCQRIAAITRTSG